MNTPALESAIEASHKALAAILKGDQSGYLGLFSAAEDVTLGNPFGPFGRGRKNVEERLAIAASKYRDGRNANVELIEKYVSDNLACVAEVESGEARVAGSAEMTKISVRVTSVFRLEAGNWKLVHRHADPLAMPQWSVSSKAMSERIVARQSRHSARYNKRLQRPPASGRR
jgi:ketosteroid isomerase-like protein